MNEQIPGETDYADQYQRREELNVKPNTVLTIQLTETNAIITFCILLLPPQEGYVFVSVCCIVCPSVRQSTDRIIKKLWMNLNEILRGL